MKIKKIALACACAGMTALAGQAQAANWLMLQGTEPEGAAGRAKVWGFIQAQYQKDFSDGNPGDVVQAGANGCAGNATDCYIPPKLIGPDLSSQSSFNVNRARIGVRGANFPLDGKTNYFILAEFGNNGITSAGGSAARITDASITLNHIPGARVRMGLFKTPGPEEALQAIHVFDYVNFTTVTNQLMLERFSSGFAGTNVGAQTLPVTTSLNTFDRPVGAFRDVGIQIFDTFKQQDWEHSYALMIGNGNGLNFSDNNSKKDLYAYWSSEKVFGGKGGRREGLKMFAWYHKGKRTYDADGVASNDGGAGLAGPGSGTDALRDFDRKRYGIGVKYLKKPFRATAEYMKGDGMIFVGPDKSSYAFKAPGTHPTNPNGILASGLEGKANGWYVEGGWYIPGTKWEVDARYDVYNRLTDQNFEMKFSTATLGAQYHLNKKTRINMEYAFRDFEAVNFASNAGPNRNLDGVKGRAAIQVTAIY